MKKNITINLCGRLFSIDEDAYEMLSTYEQSLRNYFRTREGGEEIANDLEERIAELLDELKVQGTEAITIEHVTEVIHRLGKPEEMESLSPDPSPVREGSDNTSDSEQAPFYNTGGDGGEAYKRLYRNPDDKKLLGVLSGFAAYFGGDVLWWRLGYVGLLLLAWIVPWVMPISIVRYVFVGHVFVYEDGAFLNNLLFVFIYIVFAVLMPVAETPEDRLRMKGKEVNPQNLAEEITNSGLSPNPSPVREGSYGSDTSDSSPLYNREEAASSWGKGHRGPSGCISGTFGCIGGFFSALWVVITTLFRWCLYAFGAFIAVMSLIGIFMLFVVAFAPINHVFSNSFMDSPEFAALLPSLKAPFIVFLVSTVLVLAITAYAIIHSLLNEFKQMPPMPYRQRIFLLVMWIGGLIAAGSALGSRWVQFIEAENKYNSRVWAEYDFRDRTENTHDGIYVNPREWEWLQDNGWKILNAQGCNDRFTTEGQHLSGNEDVCYLDCYDEQHRQRYRVERTDTLQPGIYRLTCAARANGTGACIYAIVGDGQPIFKEIPATGNEGGDIWAEAEKFVRYHEDNAIPSDSVAYGNEQSKLVEANYHRGYGWNRITIEPIHITKPTALRYGLTSDDAFTGMTWLGQYFSATDFEVSRIGTEK